MNNKSKEQSVEQQIWLIYPLIGAGIGLLLGLCLYFILRIDTDTDVSRSIMMSSGAMWGLLFGIVNYVSALLFIRSRQPRLHVITLFILNFIITLLLVVYDVIPLPTIVYALGLATVVALGASITYLNIVNDYAPKIQNSHS